MPSVNWERFLDLAGSAEKNFEQLCRAIIRRQYYKNGKFSATASQPGVEFHLRLENDCDLGSAGMWFGWQCRWWSLPSGKSIGTNRRKKIVDAIKTTEKHLPDLTDWILWTRYPLTEGDQKWFRSLKTQMQLHLWSAIEAEELLIGPAELIKGSYFGQLILGPEDLRGIHKISVAPIKKRWRPEVHQGVQAERTIREMLGEFNENGPLVVHANRIIKETATSKNLCSDLDGNLKRSCEEIFQQARMTADLLLQIQKTIQDGELDILNQNARKYSLNLKPELFQVPRLLGKNRHPSVPHLTNLIDSIESSHRLIRRVDKHLRTRIVAVLAGAGCGKTELSAQISAENDSRSAGILLLGKYLHLGHSLDDLAKKISIQGQPVLGMQALIAALNAAGRRSGKRLPLVIDGLNESEDPRMWKDLLLSLDAIIKPFPYVMVICTLRPQFASQCIPNEIKKIEFNGFGGDFKNALKRYFHYYKIDYTDAALPSGLLRHPLTLSIFCEVTNPSRKNIVGVEAIPNSLSVIFERYIEQIVQRIVDLASSAHRYTNEEVQNAINIFGKLLWIGNSRAIGETELRKHLQDDKRSWNASIVHAFEQEGLVLRNAGEIAGENFILPTYDALGGHIIAKAILNLKSRSAFEEWARRPEVSAALGNDLGKSHPLAKDIFTELVGILPRRHYGLQLWKIVDEPLRSEAILSAVEIESIHLDNETVLELSSVLEKTPSQISRIENHLYRIRSSTSHPLNSKFMDAILTKMSVSDRDLYWSDWLRKNDRDIIEDIKNIERNWISSKSLTASDSLRALWVKWLLTSTNREIRDRATRALYCFGRRTPSVLFGIASDGLAENDAYVSERLMAASYGVALAYQFHDKTFADTLKIYLANIEKKLFDPSSSNPTNNWLIRLYVENTIKFARIFYPEALSERLFKDNSISFAPGPKVEPIERSDYRSNEVSSTLGMDFENYTLGHLVKGRRNYDMDHPDHMEIVAYVKGVIWTLGWRQNTLGNIDRGISRRISRTERAEIERYGKKYSWIAYYEYAGILQDKRMLSPERLSELQIDPTFPKKAPKHSLNFLNWLDFKNLNDEQWMKSGRIRVPEEMFHLKKIGNEAGPWTLVDGYVSSPKLRNKNVFGLFYALLVKPKDCDALISAINEKEYLGNHWLPESPKDYYTFAGEIPWSHEFNNQGESESPYKFLISIGPNKEVEVEILSHAFSWESYHSSLNQAGHALVPSKSFSEKFKLKTRAQSFNQFENDGKLASYTLSVDGGYGGQLLYLRDDILKEYAGDREIVLVAWGERQTDAFMNSRPEWLMKIYSGHQHLWKTAKKWK